MINNNDSKYFIELCHKMSSTLYEVPYPEVDISFDEWQNITYRAVKGIKESLYGLSTDKQREFFMLDVFENIFNELNNIFYLISFEYLFKEDKIREHAIEILEKRRSAPDFELEPECYVQPWDRYFLHGKSTSYIDRCSLSVYTFTSNVALLCYDWGINFEDIADRVMVWNNVSSGDIRWFFHYKVSSGGYMVMGDYEAPDQQKCEESAKVVPQKQHTLESIFTEQYKGHVDLFTSALYESNILNSENHWITKAAHSYDLFEILKKHHVILATTSDTAGACAFKEKFGVSEASFKGKSKTPESVIEKFEEIISVVLSDIRLIQ